MKLLLTASAALATALCGLGLVAVLVGASGTGVPCADESPPLSAGHAGSWLATSYGPPWGGIEGNGVTTTGIDLRSAPPMLEVAVDPSVIRLGSWVYVQPNPF